MRRVWRNPWVQLATVAGGLGLLAWLLYVLRGPLTPFAVAMALAYFLNPAVNAIEALLERRLAQPLRRFLDPRAVALGVLVTTLALLMLALVLFVVPFALHQVSEAAQKLPEYMRVLRAKVEPAYERLNLRYPEETEAVRQQVEETLRSNLPQLLTPLRRVVAAAFSSAVAFLLALLNLLVIPVFMLYLLYDMNRLRAGVKELVPHRFRDYVYSRVRRVDTLLSAFARGQVTVCLMLGVFYAIGLTFCGVPMGLLVGLVIGFFNLIPFMSHVIGLPLALLLSWLDDQSVERLLAVAAIFVFGQFVEGNFVTPRIVGRSVGLHSVVVMLAVLVGGTFFGLVGMLLAVPVTASLSVFWTDLRDFYLGSEFYRGGEPPPAGA